MECVVIVYLTSQEIAKTFFTVAVPCYNPTSHVWEFQLLRVLGSSWCYQYFYKFYFTAPFGELCHGVSFPLAFPFPCWLTMSAIILCVYVTSVDPLRWRFCSNFLSILFFRKLAYFLIEFYGIFYTYFKAVFHLTCKSFLSISGLSFHIFSSAFTLIEEFFSSGEVQCFHFVFISSSVLSVSCLRTIYLT